MCPSPFLAIVSACTKTFKFGMGPEALMRTLLLPLFIAYVCISTTSQFYLYSGPVKSSSFDYVIVPQMKFTILPQPMFSNAAQVSKRDHNPQRCQNQTSKKWLVELLPSPTDFSCMFTSPQPLLIFVDSTSSPQHPWLCTAYMAGPF